MRKLLLFVALNAILCFKITGQATRHVNDAFIITRMVEKFHFQPKPLDNQLSASIFKQLFKQLDPDKIILTADDIRSLLPYEHKLDDEIKERQSSFLKALISVYEKRLVKADTIITEIASQPFNFSVAEKFSVSEDTSYPVDAEALRAKLFKVLKASALQAVITNTDLTGLNSSHLKKYTDSIEPVVRRKIQKTFSRKIKIMLQSPGGVQQAVGEEYCKAIASCYDPHTTFLPLTEKENFESHLGQKSMAFGFSLDEDEEGEVLIDDLSPGSPAFQSGQINKGDKIESVQWEGKEAIDVAGAGIEELGQTLGASNHEKATLKVKKADGTTREVSLWKATREDNDDDNKVKSFVLKGTKTIGFLSLPAFYEDWENGEGVNGCANDVAKEILKLQKENIEGLILDLRYNGGGSMEEAVALAGIFIDAGPVGQYKTKDARIYTLKDANRGTVYDGPLMVLVNGYSASASEVIAGTFQDYNRAVILGSPTYGKATSQVILPMDTTVTYDTDVRAVKGDSYIKLTVSQLYRLNGKTAQAAGIQPDIAVPDPLEAQDLKESANPFFLRAKDIDANKYYKPLQTLPLSALNVAAKSKIEESLYFKLLKKYINNEKASQQKKDRFLKLSDALLERDNASLEIPSPFTTKATNSPFTVQTHSFQNARLQANHRLREMDQQWKNFLGKDPYVKLAYELMLLLSK